MSSESSNLTAGWNCAREALAEMRAYPGGLQTFVAEMFDRLDDLTQELLAHRLDGQRAELEVGREGLQHQIDHLTSVVDELAAAVVQQKESAGRKN